MEGVNRGQGLQTSDVHGPQPRKRGGLKEREGGGAGVIVSPPHRITVPARSCIFEIWESFWFESTWRLSVHDHVKGLNADGR